MANKNVIVTLRLKNKADTGEKLEQLCREFFMDTRQFEGCLWVHAYRKEDSAEEVLFLEEWDSVEHYKKYLDWRRGNGTLDRMTSLLDGPPVIEYWPQKID
ncbi:MAG TPA: antibiotic biosynthesis monooxygenase [Bryobacteraceae bacterium]|nr:antibiotic biosynthesis monooxygenase [Bryobacteraceae bacterium]